MRMTAVSSPTGDPDAPATPDPEVEVLDAFDNPVPAVGVRFDVTDGGGSTTALVQLTGATGRASVGWLLGQVEGLNRLVATAIAAGLPIPNVTGNPVTFDVTTVVGGTIRVFVGLYGTPLPGATVSLTGAAARTGVTAVDGYATFTGLPPGQYIVTLTPPAGTTFSSTTQQVSLTAGQTVTIEFEGFGATAVDTTTQATSGPLSPRRKSTIPS
jgi:hypothetical protein